MVNNNMSEYYLKIIIIGDLGVGKLLWGAVIAGISDFLANFWRQNFLISAAAVVCTVTVYLLCFALSAKKFSHLKNFCTL